MSICQTCQISLFFAFECTGFNNIPAQMGLLPSPIFFFCSPLLGSLFAGYILSERREMLHVHVSQTLLVTVQIVPDVSGFIDLKWVL